MTCPVCGKASPCVHERTSASALSNDMTFPDDQALAAAAAVVASNTASDQDTDAGAAWRQEIASRVEQHRARRRRPVDPTALELDFSGDTPHSFGALARDGALPPPPSRFAQILIDQKRVQAELARPEPKIIRFPRTQPSYVPTVEEVTLEELDRADPLPDAPRILDVADQEVANPELSAPEIFENRFAEAEYVEAEGQKFEYPGFADPGFANQGVEPQNFLAAASSAQPAESYVEPYPVQQVAALRGHQLDLLPSFADIRLEAEVTRHDDIAEVIPRPAPLNQRFVSSVVDAGIVFIATGVFALTFVESADEMPQSRLMLMFMLAAAGIFWLLFQYVFLMFRRTTPGMAMAQLELCTFAGSKASPLDKQRRALASALSTFSMGLGYAWALVDEDRVGWHDRISQTHMRATGSSFIWPEFLRPKAVAMDPYEFDDLKN